MNMKTPQEWMNQFTGLHEPILVTVNQMAIRDIQLDAFKAGAEWAATLVDTHYMRTQILSASSNLKEIPK